MRSLRTRLIGVTLIVVLLAVGVTAWITNRETSGQVRAAVERQHLVEAGIYEALSFHAFSEGTWEGVDDLVRDLALEYDERVALTDPDGAVIADSAILLEGEAPPLPDTPVSLIDPGSPVISFDAPADSPFLAGAEELMEQAEDLAARLDEAGVSFRLGPEDFGIDYPVWDEGDPLARAIAEGFFRERATGELPVRMDLPADLLGFLNDQAEELAALLEDAGVAHRLAGGPLGLQFVEWDYTDHEANHVVEAFYDQIDLEGLLSADVLPIGLPDEPAEPALLFLGVAGEAEALPDPVGWRLLAAVALLALLAVVVTVAASRRILKPVGALTGAARRLASGQLSERVDVRGGDEMAVLGGAFNSMAASLQEQDRLRRALTSDVAHELRTPLSNIRGYLEAIQEGVAEPAPGVIDSIHTEAVHLQRLIDDLQEISLAESGGLPIRMEPADLMEIAARAIGGHRSTAEAAGIELGVEGAEPVVADVDEGRVRQVLDNLIDNALRHTPSGGAVTVRVGREPGSALLAVADTGAGIPPEHLPNVFERLYRSDPSRARATGGSGLGLAIARALVRAHGGEITVESAPGEGSVFTVRLPST